MEIQIQGYTDTWRFKYRYIRIHGDSDTGIYGYMEIRIQAKRKHGDFQEFPRDSDTEKYTDTGSFQ